MQKARADYRVGEFPLSVGVDASIEFTKVGLGEPAQAGVAVVGVILGVLAGHD